MDTKGQPPFNLPGMPPKENKEERDKKEDETPENSPINANRDLMILLAIFVFIVILYILNNLFGGGSTSSPKEPFPQVPGSDQTIHAGEKAKQKEESESSGGGIFSGLQSFLGGNKPSVPKNTNVMSFYHGWISLSSGTARSAIYPGREYISITINKDNLSYLNIADWSLEDSNGDRYYLGKASKLPMTGRTNTETPIVVDAGDTIIVSSGNSPIDVSFEQNTCSGYLEQFKDFFPPIPQSCPSPSWSSTWSLESSCRDFVRALPECQTAPNQTPSISASCRNFIQTEIGYNACVKKYKDNPGFHSGVWRVYLNQDEEIWKSTGDTIVLLDGKGKVVDAINY